MIYEINEATEYMDSRLLRPRPVSLKCDPRPTASTSLGSTIRGTADFRPDLGPSESESLVAGETETEALTIPSGAYTHQSLKGLIKVERRKNVNGLRVRGRISRRPLNLIWAPLKVR